MLRSLVIGQLGHYGDTDIIQEAQKRFSDYCSGGSSLAADLKAAVFSTCLANGDGSTFDQLIKVSSSLWMLFLEGCVSWPLILSIAMYILT